MTDQVLEPPRRRPIVLGQAGRPGRHPRPARRAVHVEVAGVPVELQSLRARPIARHRYRHRLLANGGAGDGRHEPVRRFDRRLRRHDGGLPDAGRGPAGPVRLRAGVGPGRRARLAQRLHDRQERRQQFHCDAGERQLVLRRYVDPHQGHSAQCAAAIGGGLRPDADRRRLGVADAGRRCGDRRRPDRLLPLLGRRTAVACDRRQSARGRDVGRAGRTPDHRCARALRRARGGRRTSDGRARRSRDAGGRRPGLATAILSRAGARRRRACRRLRFGRAARCWERPSSPRSAAACS